MEIEILTCVAACCSLVAFVNIVIKDYYYYYYYYKVTNTVSS